MPETIKAFVPSQIYELTNEEKDKLHQINSSLENSFGWVINDLLKEFPSIFSPLFNCWMGLAFCIRNELACLSKICSFFSTTRNTEILPDFFKNTFFVMTIPVNLHIKDYDESYSKNCIIYLAKYLLENYDLLNEFEYQRCLILPYVQRILAYIYYALGKSII